MPITDPIALAHRARTLGPLTGLEQLRVTLDDSVSPPQAYLDVKFWTANMVAQIAADPQKPSVTFPVFGGHRLRAGSASGMVQVTQIAQTAVDTLRLTVVPIGDYSTYSLTLQYANVDSVFSSLDFKFRPGCFSVDCAPDWTSPPPPQLPPVSDMLARDYVSYRHALIVAMQKRVPGWLPTSDADLTLTLIDLFAAAGDELADYQDRVMNEAYLATARNRVSLARHARLMDYQIHQGNQASTLLAVRVVTDVVVDAPAPIVVTSSDPGAALGATFVSIERSAMLSVLNDIPVYTWDDTRPALAKGDTAADVLFPSPAAAAAAIALWTVPGADGAVPPVAPPRLLLAEELDPANGSPVGADLNKRQILRVIGAHTVTDLQHPSLAIVRVSWSEDDALAYDYCVVETPAVGRPPIRDICKFHGNLILATSGRAVSAQLPAIETAGGTVCPLPASQPLLYLDTPPDGIIAPISTLAVAVADGSTSTTYVERISLVHSEANDTHFIVETDERLRSRLRFGNGVNGRAPGAGASIMASWRTGLGLEGNVGRDRLIACTDPRVASVWNPFDAANGRAPELAAEIRRNAPEAYRQYQLRAVTLADYIARAEQVDGVSRAAATYMWTGSWRTVRVTVDPAGTDVLVPELAAAVAAHLEPLRMIGEDLEIRAPIYVPLRIALTVCVSPDVWPEDVRYVIEQELSDGYTADGRHALFHPDNWTFGQPLFESEIAGRLQKIDGVEHVASIGVYRWDAATPGNGRSVAVGASEIIQVHNDPDHMERGFIELELTGGRS